MNWKRKILSFKIAIIILAVSVSCITEREKSAKVAITEVAAKLPYYVSADFTPQWLTNEEATAQKIHTIAPFTLFNQNGETVTEEMLEGKIYVADFFFTTCPGICPAMTENMNILQEKFLDDEGVQLLSFSVTPEKDSVPVLKQYANAKGIKQNTWQLLTGNQKMIYDLGRKSYFIEEDLGLTKAADDFLHTENFVLVDGDKHIRGIYNGLNKTSVQQLIADIMSLKKEH